MALAPLATEANAKEEEGTDAMPGPVEAAAVARIPLPVPEVTIVLVPADTVTGTRWCGFEFV